MADKYSVVVDDSVALDAVPVTLTWTEVAYYDGNGEALAATGLALTNTDGTTEIWNGATSVPGGFSVANGAKYGKITVGISGTYATLGSKIYTIRLSGEGNARVSDSASSVCNPTNNYVDKEFTFNANGACSTTYDIYFSVGPNNTAGPEYKTGAEEGYTNQALHTADKISGAQQAVRNA